MICLQFCGKPVVIETTQNKRCFSSLAELSRVMNLNIFFCSRRPAAVGEAIKIQLYIDYGWVLTANCTLNLRNLSRYKMKYDISRAYLGLQQRRKK